MPQHIAAPFLTARWENLTLANYAVPDDLLTPLLAPGLELDRWQGQAYVSLVAFDFLNTKVWRIGWPGFRNFPELNLRFYVRQGERRGVQFVREYVPSRWVAALARGLYNEPYYAAPMRNEHQDGSFAYRIHWQGRDHHIRSQVEADPHMPAADSREHFFKEHNYGYGTSRRRNLVTYEVYHPIWQVRTITKLDINVDFAALYGEAWAWLNQTEPTSAVFALGSAIEVSQKNRGLAKLAAAVP